MGFIEPLKTGFTIYSKSGCPDCRKAKDLLNVENDIQIINCDEYLLEDKEEFLNYIKEKTKGVECRTFPMIFYGEEFIGGLKKLQIYYEEYRSKKFLDDSFENTDF